ncbi:TetR/AcrR family transcriptional regulator [Marinibactrum halimedae]|uniref:TetR family transcriptional regulator n=1 Tax=Marinibactrum halimedae TaxID=1444977 RepID=A0AA37TAJ5_9GAMM|nr:TetR/AcrR family transcriptional regulator [Marinibactrum halimedae]MCD9459666.1 TetR/AcrR family transcriptional regulator [Marinibactrum halimedae]GLS25692.1 TetR family transcriptional regulator [Marinibactrum halimedae]
MNVAVKKYKPGKIRERNEELILEAAEQEFVLHGFKGTSVQAIADRAGLPKANIHYYFKNKSNLYSAVLSNIIDLWNDSLEDITADDDPAEVLRNVIRKKVELSYLHPRSSKLFAMEIIQGAPHIREYIRSDMRQWVRSKTKVFDAWIAAGKMDPIDPVHLIFMIWSTTQHYADFETQVLTLMNRAEYERDDIERITNCLVHVILKGCGLNP